MEREREFIIKEALIKGELRPEDDNETINECRSNWGGPVAYPE
uniref:HTH gntR-type domain-containing protein n=1 Tax=Heterorhabditis bacteriophora TaxID=37862 RepID=A0A1I7XS69_HETBA